MRTALIDLRFAAVACLAISATAMKGQSAKDAENNFKTSLLQQQVYVRNFSADSVVNARWTGSGFELDEPGARMLSSVLVRSVRVKAKKVEIGGDRYFVTSDGGKVERRDLHSSVKVVIDLGQADVATVLPGLRAALFYSDQTAALAALQVASAKPSVPAVQSLPACDCADRGTDACKGRSFSLTPPRLLHVPPPEYSVEPLRNSKKGVATFEMTVDTAGMPTNIWLRKPAGGDMDDKAIQTVRQYRFSPAACHDKPEAITMDIVVNFQIN